jgi:hypothetical protein
VYAAWWQSGGECIFSPQHSSSLNPTDQPGKGVPKPGSYHTRQPADQPFVALKQRAGVEG